MPLPLVLTDRNAIRTPPDLLIIGKDNKHRVHSIVFLCISPYFQKALRYGKKNYKGMHEIRMPLSDQIIEKITKYAYTGIIDPLESMDDAVDLIVAADEYNIIAIIGFCCNYISSQIEVSNCIGIYKFATFYQFQSVKETAERFILRNYSLVYQNSEEFDTLIDKDVLKHFIGRDDLLVDDETHVWKSVVKWICADETKRYEHFNYLCESVRCGLLDLDEINDILKHYYVIKCNKTEKILERVRTLCDTLVNPTPEKVLKSISELNLSPFSDGTCNINSFFTPRHPKEVILLIGGRPFDAEFVEPEESIEVYDHRAERWKFMDFCDPKGARDHHQMVIIDHDVYVIGGHRGRFVILNSCRKFNTLTKEWTEIAPMREKRAFHGCVVINKNIYSIGGFNGSWRMDTCERYDPNLNQWFPIASMNERRSGAGAAVVNGNIYIIGGFRETNYLNSVECYNPETNKWKMAANMRQSRSSAAVIAFRNNIYAIGGLSSNGLLSCGERFDVIANLWSSLETEMFEKKCSASIAIIEERYVMVIGGWNGTLGSDATEIWDIIEKKWKITSKLNKRRTGCAAVVIPNDIANIGEYLWKERDILVEQRLRQSIPSVRGQSEVSKGLSSIN